MTTFWTDEDLEIAQKMYLKGHTVFQIATVLRRSRSSVIGKISRMRLKREIVKSEIVKPTQPGRSTATLPAAIEPLMKVPKRGPIPFLVLQSHHCRAVLDQRDAKGGALFCGEPKAVGSSWCPTHRGLYIQLEPHHGQAGHRDQSV